MQQIYETITGVASRVLKITRSVASILIVIPTHTEAEIIFPSLDLHHDNGIHIKNAFREPDSRNNVDILVTGPGPVFTTFHLVRVLAGKEYDACVQTGVCGSHDRSVPLADIVTITSDRFIDFGAGSPDGFIDAVDLGFYAGEPLMASGIVRPDLPDPELIDTSGIPDYNGVTVMTTTGTDEKGSEIRSLYGAVMETMEGASLFYSCMQFRLPCIQVRGVSNYAGIREKENWKISESLLNIRNYFEEKVIRKQD